MLGEDAVAFVILYPGAEADGDELRAFALEQLADYKVPRQYVFIDATKQEPPATLGVAIEPQSRWLPTVGSLSSPI